MSVPTSQLDALRGHFQLHFTDRPRATRSLTLLQRLREAAGALQPASGGTGRSPAGDELGALLAAWDEEAEAIATAQHRAGDGGRLLVEALEAADRVRWRVGRLQRLHPAPPAARPVLLAALEADVAGALAELAEARRHAAAQAALRGDGKLGLQAAESVRRELQHTLEHLQAARAGALAARRSGDPVARQRAAVSAARAALADLSETVVGRSPVVVRPEHLSALVQDLRQAAATFAEPTGDTPEGSTHDAHAKNVAALAEQVTFWQRQLRQVTAKRRQHTADELAHAVGEEADAVMEAAEAAHGPDAARLLGYLCLRMDELHRQLRGVPLVFGHEAHRETLAGLADCLAWLERSRAAAGG